MAKFKKGNLDLKTNQRVRLGDNRESHLFFNGTNTIITMSTGMLAVNGNITASAPTADNHLTTKLYVDNAITAGGVHNSLVGLQGGDSTSSEFYHLTQDIHDGLFSGSPIIGLGNETGTRFAVDYGSDTAEMYLSSSKVADFTSSLITIGDSVADRGYITVDKFADSLYVYGGGDQVARLSNNVCELTPDPGQTEFRVSPSGPEIEAVVGGTNPVMRLQPSLATFRVNTDIELSLDVGNEGTNNGTIDLFGGPTGQDQGGIFRIHPSDDHDGTITHYAFQTHQDDLRIGPNTDEDAFKYDGGANRWEMTDGSNTLLSVAANSQRFGEYPGGTYLWVEQASDTMQSVVGGASTGLYISTNLQRMGSGTDTRLQTNQSSNQIVGVCGGSATTLDLTDTAQTIGVSGASRIDIDQTVDELDFYTDASHRVNVSHNDTGLDAILTYDYQVTGFLFPKIIFTNTIVGTGTLTMMEHDYVNQQVTVPVGKLEVGATGERGTLYCHGDHTGSTGGGTIILYTADDYDTQISFYNIWVREDDLWIGPGNDQDAMKYVGATRSWEFSAGASSPDLVLDLQQTQQTMGDTGGNVWMTLNHSTGLATISAVQGLELPKGILSVGEDGVLRGTIECIGNPTGTAGGSLFLHTGDAHDSSISGYQLAAFEDDWWIGPANDPDALKYDGANTRWEFTTTVQGQTPVNSADLVTKAYVDALVGGETFSGVADIPQDATSVNVVYSPSQPDGNYSLVTHIINKVDWPPSIYSHMTTDFDKDGFSELFSGPIDSANYKLHFIISRNDLESSSSSSSSSSSKSSSSSSSSSKSSSSSSSSSSSGVAGPIAAWLTGFPDNPNYIEVVAGTAWTFLLSEDDLVRLYRVPGTTIWSEDGTLTPDTTTNRVRMDWVHTGTATTTSGDVSVQLRAATGGGTNWTQFAHMQPQGTYSTGNPYSFKAMWGANQSWVTDTSGFITTSPSYQTIWKAMNFVTNTMPAGLSGFPLPPDHIQVTIGTGWTAQAPFSEDDTVNLYRVAGTRNWSETGEATPNAQNRILMQWNFLGTTTQTGSVKIQVITSGATAFASVATATTSTLTYTFKDFFTANKAFAADSAYFTTSSVNMQNSIFKTFNFITV